MTKTKPSFTRQRKVVTLYQGDYEPRLAEIAAAVEQAKLSDSMSARFGTARSAMRLAKEYDALREEAEQTAVKITLEALPRSDWRKIVADHPPRDGNDFDQRIGANQDTIHEATVPACVVDPTFAEAEWVEFADSLSEPAWQKLAAAAWELNVRGVDLPKSSLVSQLLQQSDDDSK